MSILLSFYSVDDQVDVLFGEGVVHGEADDGVGHVVGDGEVAGGGAFETAVGGEGGDEGVEVAAAEDAGGFKTGVELVAGLAVEGGVDEDGEVGVVVAHAGHVVEECDAWHCAEGGTISVGHVMAGVDGGVDLPEVEQAVGGAHLVHLGVDARSYHLGLAGETKVLEVVDALLRPLVVHDEGATLDGVVNLGGVKREGRHIALAEYASTVDLYAKGVGGVVDDLKAIFIGDGLNAGGVAGLAIDVDGHDGGGAWGDSGFDEVGVEVAGGGVDVDEDGLDAVPPEGVGGSHEAIWCGDDLAGDAKSLEGGDERQGAVGEERDIWHAEVFGESVFELLVEGAVVGYPSAIPNLFQRLVEVVEVGKEGGGDGDHSASQS